jgi:hypothetical protein
MSGRKIAEAFKNGRKINLKERYFRFNAKFDGREPSLNDINKMQELTAKIRK